MISACVRTIRPVIKSAAMMFLCFLLTSTGWLAWEYHLLEQIEREKFDLFSMRHNLSARERDMLRLILEGKTNAEFAGAFSISENTVKFHVRHILQKTGCKNRKDLIAVYSAPFPV